MGPESIFGIVLAAAIVLGVVAKLLPKSQPKSRVFKCARCKNASPHNDRTIEAWRNNKTTFFCQACHAKWLQSRPPEQREQIAARSTSNKNSGCLSVVALFALLPLGCLLIWAYA